MHEKIVACPRLGLWTHWVFENLTIHLVFVEDAVGLDTARRFLDHLAEGLLSEVPS
jgi:hypothetical protein